MLFSLAMSSISHRVSPHSSAALPIEILCCRSLSSAFCIFQEFTALANNLLIASDLSACQFFSISDKSLMSAVSSLTEIVVAIVFNIIECIHQYLKVLEFWAVCKNLTKIVQARGPTRDKHDLKL